MANVTEAQMARYLAVFHDEYVRSVEQFVPEGVRGQLLRYPLLPAPIKGYVSTQLGAGFEYGDPGASQITVERSSRRIERLFLGAPPSFFRLSGAVLLGNGNSAAFEDSRFKDVIPFGFEDENAGWVRLANVDLSHRTWHRHVRFAELFSHRTSDFWSEVEAIRRAKDEVLTVSFDLQAATAREVDISTYLASFKEKTVLVLGDFKSGRDRLSAIKAALARRSYLPIVLDEIVEEPNYDLRQKFQAVAAVCRFCVFDDSTAAGQIAEMSIADPLNIVRIILRMGQQQSTYMTRGTALTSRVVREWEYTLETLDEVVAQAATWAESTVKDLAIGREEAYPWRKQES